MKKPRTYRFDSLSECESEFSNGWPDQYLAVEECRSGTYWIRRLRANASLDLRTQLLRWCREEFAGELTLDGKLMPKLKGDYYGQIITDNRPVTGAVVWDGGGFYLKEPGTKLFGRDE